MNGDKIKPIGLADIRKPSKTAGLYFEEGSINQDFFHLYVAETLLRLAQVKKKGHLFLIWLRKSLVSGMMGPGAGVSCQPSVPASGGQPSVLQSLLAGPLPHWGRPVLLSSQPCSSSWRRGLFSNHHIKAPGPSSLARGQSAPGLGRAQPPMSHMN